MNGAHVRLGCAAGILAFSLLAGIRLGAAEPGDELVQMVVNLLGEKDADLRAVGFEQVRTEAKGAAATKQFAAQLPKLSPPAQVGLLSALADRADVAARPAVLELLAASPEESVRVAAIKALGTLGEPANLPLLMKLAEGEENPETLAARATLARLPGANTNALIAAQLKLASPTLRSILIEVLATRRAFDTIPELLAGAVDQDPAVRVAAMAALAQLASVEHLPKMLSGVLQASAGAEREAAEKAVVSVCRRGENGPETSTSLLAAVNTFPEPARLALLPTLGRVGGTPALNALNEMLKSPNSASHEAALEALCLWPDASIADQLLNLTQNASSPAERDLTFRALVRVSSLRDKRTDRERLSRLQTAMSLAQSPDEQALVIKNCRLAYSVESLRYVLPFLDQPEFAPVACETIVELAHHRELREPNKAEFDPALDRVLLTTTNEILKDRAQRYKKGQTWYRPKTASPPPNLALPLTSAEPAAAAANASIPAATQALIAAGASMAFLALIAAWCYFRRQPAQN